MVVGATSVVSLVYELKVGEETVERVEKESPFVFLFGTGHLIEKFESNIDGNSVGDSFDFVLKEDDAYGPFRMEAIIDLPRSLFVIDGKPADDLLVVDTFIAMQDEHGNPMKGKVMEVGEEKVKMDFNHPLAGKDLHFKGEIIDVREATEDEISHGHVHGPGGHHH